MKWQEMGDEMLMDVAQITTSAPETESVVGIIQWHGELLAGPLYQPNTFPLTPHHGETPVEVGAVSILPDPATAPVGHWRPIDLKVWPKKNGIPTTEDMPIMYLVILKHARGEGLAFPSRQERGGRVRWSGNPSVIDRVKWALVKVGIIRADEIGAA